MGKIVFLRTAAAGTRTWTADKDYTLVSVFIGGSASVLSKDPAQVVASSMSDGTYDEFLLTPGQAGTVPFTGLNYPVAKGDKFFAVSGASGVNCHLLLAERSADETDV